MGFGEIETFTLTPTKAESTDINFYYKQSWEENSLDTIKSQSIIISR